MEDSEKNELIDRYLKGALNAKEQAEFDRLVVEPEFKAELDFRIQLVEASKNVGRADLKKRFANLDHNETVKIEPPISTFIVYRRYIAIAASLAILACAIFLIKPSNTVSEKDALYAANYSTLLNKITITTRGEVSKDSLSIGMEYYDKGDYPKALKIFKAFIDREPKLKMYMGVIEYEKADYQKALEYWNPIGADQQHVFTSDALWYSAHAYYQLGNTELSIEILKKLSKYFNSYQRRADEMLKQLELDQ